MANSNVAAVILAAGASTRFGKPKQLLKWIGLPLVTHTVDTAWIAGLTPRVTVVGSSAPRVREALQDRTVTLVHNYHWAEGMSTSVNLGLSALPPQVQAALFLPIDQPLVDADLLRRLIRAWEEGRGSIVVPRGADGKRGSPVLFDRVHFPELARLTGDVGGRALFANHPNAITYVTVADPMTLTDVDTPQALAELKACCEAREQGPAFADIDGVISDMDGVFWRGDTSLPGLEDFFALLKEKTLPHVLVTNNSSHTPRQYVKKLAGMSIRTTPDHVLNSAEAAAQYVADEAPNARVYTIGGPGVRHALKAHGLHVTQAEDTPEVDYVVVGWDRKLTWQKLAVATRLIHRGAAFVGTNPDRTFPMESALAPGNGAQLAALEAATDVKPVIAGKPEAVLYRQAMARMGTEPERTLMIGDRLDTDILGAVRLGMPTVLLLTGISDHAELQRSPIRPTGIYEDLPALAQAWRRALEAQAS